MDPYMIVTVIAPFLLAALVFLVAHSHPTAAPLPSEANNKLRTYIRWAKSKKRARDLHTSYRKGGPDNEIDVYYRSLIYQGIRYSYTQYWLGDTFLADQTLIEYIDSAHGIAILAKGILTPWSVDVYANKQTGRRFRKHLAKPVECEAAYRLVKRLRTHAFRS